MSGQRWDICSTQISVMKPCWLQGAASLQHSLASRLCILCVVASSITKHVEQLSTSLCLDKMHPFPCTGRQSAICATCNILSSHGAVCALDSMHLLQAGRYRKSSSYSSHRARNIIRGRVLIIQMALSRPLQDKGTRTLFLLGKEKSHTWASSALPLFPFLIRLYMH